MTTTRLSASDLLDMAEGCGLVVWSLPNGNVEVWGPGDADDTLMREVVRRGDEIAGEIDRRTPSDGELAKLKEVRKRHRP